MEHREHQNETPRIYMVLIPGSTYTICSPKIRDYAEKFFHRVRTSWDAPDNMIRSSEELIKKPQHEE